MRISALTIHAKAKDLAFFSQNYLDRVVHFIDHNWPLLYSQHYNDLFVHFIDDGPYLLSLEALVQHYSTTSDGLPCTLRFSINTCEYYHACF